nr:methyltransferase domain-containing protein [uncultured Desulfuromonas sp.]
MESASFPPPDSNGIIRHFSAELSTENLRREKAFGRFAWMYDLAQNHWVRPRIHKADTRRHGEILAAMLNPFQKCAVLDIACGTGAAIAYLDRSSRYTGLDLSYPMLQRARKKARKKNFAAARFIHGNAEELLFAAKTFDLVVLDTALHMIADYKKTLAAIGRVLKKEGVLVCSVPVTGINAHFDIRWRRIAEPRGLHSLTVDALAAACGANQLVFTRIADNGGVLYFQARKVDRERSTA